MRNPSGLLRAASPSTVGRGKALVLDTPPTRRSFRDAHVNLWLGDAQERYARWPAPITIVSDGAYGVLGFAGDTASHRDVASWYEPHVRAWAKHATAETTLWFWNSELGWAATHPLLESHGFRYVACNVWNKGVGHIAGNVSTGTIRRFPVVTEVCVQYVVEPRLDGQELKQWLLSEWKRTGLPLREANLASGVKDAATRKYLTQGHLWYFPPGAAVEKLAAYANQHGAPTKRPYFSLDGKHPVRECAWEALRGKFHCPHGITNVWERPAVRDQERVKTPEGRAVHLNQKPLDLMERIILSSTDPGDVVWEPFGGLFTASLAARAHGRRAYGAELDPTYFEFGRRRFLETKPPRR